MERDIIDNKESKVVSELTLAELASVISRRKELISSLAKKIRLREEIAILALIAYILRRLNLKYIPIAGGIKQTPFGKISIPLATAIELSLNLKLKTLNLLRIAYIRLLKEEIGIIDTLVTADTEFEKAENYLNKLSIKLIII